MSDLLPNHIYECHAMIIKLENRIAELESPVLPDDCIHNWIDPTNEKVESDAHRICTRCGIIAIPTESPTLPDEMQALCNKLEHSAAHRIDHPNGSRTLKPACYLCGEAKTMLEDLQAKVEELENMKAEEIVRWMRNHPRTTGE